MSRSTATLPSSSFEWNSIIGRAATTVLAALATVLPNCCPLCWPHRHSEIVAEGKNDCSLCLPTRFLNVTFPLSFKNGIHLSSPHLLLKQFACMFNGSIFWFLMLVGIRIIWRTKSMPAWNWRNSTVVKAFVLHIVNLSWHIWSPKYNQQWPLCIEIGESPEHQSGIVPKPPTNHKIKAKENPAFLSFTSLCFCCA